MKICKESFFWVKFLLEGPWLMELRGSWGPSGQNCRNAVISIELVRLSPREWPRRGRETAKYLKKTPLRVFP